VKNSFREDCRKLCKEICKEHAKEYAKGYVVKEKDCFSKKSNAKYEMVSRSGTQCTGNPR
jgi:hypothetical protein